jgi:hypothetical protein
MLSTMMSSTDPGMSGPYSYWVPLGVPTISARHAPPHEPLPYRAFPLTVYGFCLLMVGFLLQLLAALCGVISTPK